MEHLKSYINAFFRYNYGDVKETLVQIQIYLVFIYNFGMISASELKELNVYAKEIAHHFDSSFC